MKTKRHYIALAILAIAAMQQAAAASWKQGTIEKNNRHAQPASVVAWSTIIEGPDERTLRAIWESPNCKAPYLSLNLMHPPIKEVSANYFPGTGRYETAMRAEIKSASGAYFTFDDESQRHSLRQHNSPKVWDQHNFLGDSKYHGHLNLSYKLTTEFYKSLAKHSSVTLNIGYNRYTWPLTGSRNALTRAHQNALAGRGCDKNARSRFNMQLNPRGNSLVDRILNDN